MSTTTLEPVAATESTQKTTLWYTRCPCATAFSVAWQQGTLDAEFTGDKAVEFLSLQQSPDPKVYLSHFSHTQANQFRYGGNIPAIWARASGADTRLVGLAWVTTPHPILVLPDSGIKTVADLKGKRLLVVSRGADKLVDFGRATTLRTYETALATAGLTLDDVKLVEISNDKSRIDPKAVAESKIKSVLGTALTKRAGHRDVLFALIRGEVDAITVAGPASTDIKAFLGAHVVYDVGRDHPDRIARANNGFPEALTVSGSLIEERPDLVARVVARLLEAGEWARRNPKEATSFVAREQSVVDEIIEATYGSELSDVFVTDLAADKVAALRSQKDYLLRHGYIQDFDFEAWIDPRPLEAARQLLEKRHRLAA